MRLVSKPRLALAVATVVGAITIGSTVSPGTAVGGGGCHDPEPREGTGILVAIERACFRPAILYVEPGTHVTFENHDDMVHNVWGLQAVPSSGGDFRPNSEFTWTFPEQGIYPFQCTYHPTMVGAVVVGEGFAAQISRGNDAEALLRSAPGSEEEARLVPAASAPDDDDVGWPLAAIAVAGSLAGVVVGGGAVAWRSRRGQ